MAVRIGRGDNTVEGRALSGVDTLISGDRRTVLQHADIGDAGAAGRRTKADQVQRNIKHGAGRDAHEVDTEDPRAGVVQVVARNGVGNRGIAAPTCEAIRLHVHQGIRERKPGDRGKARVTNTDLKRIARISVVGGEAQAGDGDFQGDRVHRHHDALLEARLNGRAFDETTLASG